MSERKRLAAKMAADWWASRFMVQEKREAFRDALEQRVADELNRNESFYIECDYDPQGMLLEAVREAGVECRGMMFSATGILPKKHELRVTAEKLSPKEGYANWTADIEVPLPAPSKEG